MGRLARVVVPGVAHHATQRGNHQQDVFFTDADRDVYLRRLADNCARHEVRLLGYCLMTNHVHLIVVPGQPWSLARALGRTHNDYARWLHVRHGWVGHLWQNRFFSCPLSAQHCWEALRYVEANPVRAGLVEHAAQWGWSSAAAHVGGLDRRDILDLAPWKEEYTAQQWLEVLEAGHVEQGLRERIRTATRTGRPLGCDVFVAQMEQATGRSLRPRKRGPARRQSMAVGL